MLSQCLTIGLLMIFVVIMPGPDFALVTKNTLLHSRRAGIFTTLGVGAANLIHMIYCALGLAVVISKSLLLFSIIKYIGAAYLIFIGIQTLLAKPPEMNNEIKKGYKKTSQSAGTSFRQGLVCSLLNPKVTLFFLALFTTLINQNTPTHWIAVFIFEMLSIAMLWFISLCFLLSHPKVTQFLQNSQRYIAKALGLSLIGFGLLLSIVKQNEA